MKLGALLLLLLMVAPAQAATVRSIGDGDTLGVVEGDRSVTIRLACIDAPEKAQRPYGQASRAALMTLWPRSAPKSACG
jgi:micrococcal nuclease